jgi:hypothetical protein
MLLDHLFENAGSGLQIGDPVIITGPVEFQGKTGDVRELGQNGSFVVVDLYNYGPQSFQASDVSRNDYADSQDDEEVAEDSNDDINDYYAGYYADLLSQIENMSVTDQVDTKLGIKRTLENGELRLIDLKSEIKALEREINRTKQGVAEGSLDQRIAHAKKNNPLQASVRQHQYGYTALVTDANTGKPSWFGGAVWQTPELAMGHAKAFVKGFPYLEQRFAQRFVDKNFDGIADQGVAEVSLNEFAPGDGDDEGNPLDDYPCYDCGSTIYMHHTRLCDLAEPDAVRDLPAEPGTQYWTGRVPKGLKPIPGLNKGVEETVSANGTIANTSGAGAGMTASYQRRENQPIAEDYLDERRL